MLLQFMLKSVLHMVSSRNFIVSGLTFRSLIHFEYIFVYGIREWFNFILLNAAVQFSQNFVGKVMCLLLNMLTRFVIAFLPRSKCLLISWLQSLSAVILEAKKMRPATAATFSPSFAMK